MSSDAFFAADNGLFVPLEPSRGYWKHDSIHGRVIVGLLGFAIEQRHAAPGFVPARLTVDMFRMPRFAPVRIDTRVVRESARLRLIEADFVVEEQVAARATCQFVLASEPPSGHVWSAPPWDAPHPDELPAPPGEDKPSRLFYHREIAGKLGSAAPKQMWMGERYPLVEGVALTPFARAAVAVDFASPFMHAAEKGIQYINTDVTMQLHRAPVGEWIGFEVTGHEASHGIAVGTCRLHDIQGPIGFATCTALANERRR
jgi:hypothetical protein